MTTVLFSLAPMAVEVTFDQGGLNVGLIQSKWNGSGWTTVGSPAAVPSTGTGTNTYGTLWTPPDMSSWLVELAVFTDDTLTALQDGYLASSRAFSFDQSVIASLNSRSSTDIIGMINDADEVGGIVEDGDEVIGQVADDDFI